MTIVKLVKVPWTAAVWDSPRFHFRWCLRVSFLLLHPGRVLVRGPVTQMCLVPQTSSRSHVMRMNSAGGLYVSRLLQVQLVRGPDETGFCQAGYMYVKVLWEVMVLYYFILGSPTRTPARECEVVCEYGNALCWVLSSEGQVLALYSHLAVNIYCANEVL